MLSQNTAVDQDQNAQQMQSDQNQGDYYQQNEYQVDEYGNYIQPQEQAAHEEEIKKPQDIYVECQLGETTEIGAHEDLVIKISE